VTAPLAGALAVGPDPATARDGFLVVETTVEPEQPRPGADVTVTATLTNVNASRSEFVLTHAELVDEADGGDPDDPLAEEATNQRLDTGERHTVDLTTEFDRTGTRQVYVRLRVRSIGSGVSTLVRPVTVAVREPHPQVSLTTERTVAGAPTNVSVEVSNGLNRSVSSLELTLDSDSLTVDDPRRVLARLDAGANHSFRFAATEPDHGRHAVDARLSYTTANGTRHTVERRLDASFRPPTTPGTVDLTGVEVTRDGDRLTVRGTASNGGDDAVSSVRVAVADGDGVVPAQSNARYFVGRVEPSEFSSFEVASRLEENVSAVTVPLRVSYVVDGVRRTETVSVRYDVPADADPDDSGGGPLPLTLVGGGLAAAVVVVVGWRWSDVGP
jgi:hypothetical protein